MAQYLTLFLESIKVVETDPTGEECVGCGDVPYLYAFSFQAKFCGGTKDMAYLCQHCAEELQERLDAN